MKSATKETTCKACGGTGKVKTPMGDAKCIACRGSGKATGYLTK